MEMYTKEDEWKQKKPNNRDGFGKCYIKGKNWKDRGKALNFLRIN